MSPSKLIKRFTKSSESIDELEKDDKTFFCSELIAAAYTNWKYLVIKQWV